MMTTNQYTPLTSHGLIKISGRDAKKLLQGQLTCQLDDIAEDQFNFAAHCNPQGRVISFFYLLQINNDYYLHLACDMIETAMKALKKYAVFYQTSIANVSDTMKSVGLTIKDEKILSNYFTHYPMQKKSALVNEQIYLAKISNEQYLMLGEEKIIAKKTKKFATDFIESSLAQWHAEEISMKIPRIYPETSEVFLPHEIGLPELGAVNFSKGCYTGQEIIARMEYRGKLKNHLHLVSLTSTICPKPNMTIRANNKIIGTIVDVEKKSAQEYLALIILNDEYINYDALYLENNHAISLAVLN